MYACIDGHKLVVKMIDDHKAKKLFDLNATNIHGRTLD